MIRFVPLLATICCLTSCYTHTIRIPGTLDLRESANAESRAIISPPSPHVGFDAIIDGEGICASDAVAPGVDRFRIENRSWWALGFFPTHEANISSQLSGILVAGDITHLVIQEQVTGTDAALYVLSKSIPPVSLGTWWTTPTFTLTVEGEHHHTAVSP
jgi:hypothetical protein